MFRLLRSESHVEKHGAQKHTHKLQSVRANVYNQKIYFHNMTFEILLNHFNGKNNRHSKCCDVLYFFFFSFSDAGINVYYHIAIHTWMKKRRTHKNYSKYSVLLRCDAAAQGNRIQTFRRNVLHLQGSILVGRTQS
jgi:hypothetical protein